MYQNKSILALIPARGGSKGIPRKNIIPFLGKPLIAYPINAALGSKYIDQVILSSDDEEIISVAKKYNCEVPFKRPPELASDSSSSIDVTLHAIEYFEAKGVFFDFLVLLEPTSPLTESYDIDEAIEILFKKLNTGDSIVGVCKVEANHPLYLAKQSNDGTLVPYVRKDFNTPVRRQELDELYFFEGSLYISLISKLKTSKSFVHERTLPYIVPRWKSIEIDEYSDLLIAEVFYKNYLKQ